MNRHLLQSGNAVANKCHSHQHLLDAKSEVCGELPQRTGQYLQQFAMALTSPARLGRLQPARRIDYRTHQAAAYLADYQAGRYWTGSIETCLAIVLRCALQSSLPTPPQSPTGTPDAPSLGFVWSSYSCAFLTDRFTERPRIHSPTPRARVIQGHRSVFTFPKRFCASCASSHPTAAARRADHLDAASQVDHPVARPAGHRPQRHTPCSSHSPPIPWQYPKLLFC